MVMEWSNQQESALRIVNRWITHPDKQCFRMFGYAGTGKTTLAKHFAENIKGTVLFCAYTGKAAHVLREKGCTDARTIHSLIYLPREKSRLRLKELELKLCEIKEHDDPAEAIIREAIKTERDNLARPAFTLNTDSDVKNASLVILDECSMIDSRVGQDLLCFGTPVLVLGDPAQLPPVRGEGFFVDKDPDVMLTEIHRQARDNPIIRMATMVREGKKLDEGDYGEDSRVISRKDLQPFEAIAADQILVGKNATRRACNVRIREMRAYDNPYPCVGDKLVCLRNDNENGLLNGSLWDTVDVGDIGDDRMFMSIRPNGSGDYHPLDVEVHTQHFVGSGAELPWWERCEAQEFDYGYALTVHKAQGSQWPHVLLFDESHVFRQNRDRWLYTGLTRASKRITIVR